MKKRYSISKEQCTCGISELYDLDGDGYEVEVEDGFITKGV